MELHRPNTGSQKTLIKTRMFSNLLVVCANCMIIRDDLGHWHQVQVSVHEHAGVEFTYGICPACMQELYPEYAFARG